MVYLNLLVASMHYESQKAEELISVIMIESMDKVGYQTYVTKKPAMKSSYIKQLEKIWSESKEVEVEL